MNSCTPTLPLIRKLTLIACIFVFYLGITNKAKACICAAPGTVTASAATSVTSGGFQANWSTPTTSCGAITSYSVDLSTSSTFTSSVGGYPVSTGGTGTSYVISGLTCGTTYYYRIKGITCGGAGTSWSNTITVVVPACSCSDGIQNQGELGVDCGGPCTACPGNCSNGIQDGDETGVDCGGTYCSVCPTCFDGVQNGTETGIDCGGTCALSCGTNSAVATTSCSCPTGVSATVYSTTCDQVGTSAFNLNSPVVDFVNCASAATLPSSTTCTLNAPSTDGTWVHLDLSTGVTQVQLALTSGSMGSGSSTCYGAIYQGASCAALSQVGSCKKIEDFISGTYGTYNVMWSGLNPAQDAWIYLWNDGSKAFNLNFQVIGTTSTPSNSTCATANVAAGEGCNLGAVGASWTPPTTGGQTCSGGNWTSNDNTTYYSFSPTATTATLTISSISCQDGTAGSAQFAVWTSCAAIGTYTSTSTFLGCAVGTAGTNLNLTGLTSGNTYYIAVDGSGGSDCVFTFTGTNINLPVELSYFKARYNNGKVDINWVTSTEKNCNYFEVQKSLDGEHFELVTTVKGANNSFRKLSYNAVDLNPEFTTLYYRLRQVDYNGNDKYSAIDIVELNPSNTNFSVVPNPTRSSAKVNYNCVDGETCVLTVFNTNGVPVMTQTITCEKGLNSAVIDLADQAKGMYLVVLTTDTKTFKSKLVKSE